MIGNREDERERGKFGIRGSREILRDDFTVEYLGKTVGGDEPKPANFSGAGEFGSALPPIHDKIGAVGNQIICLAQRLDVAVAEFGANILAADERRITDDEVCLRPRGVRGARHARGTRN